MKIAFYIGSLANGGAERVITNLAHFFKEKGHQVVMVTKLKEANEYELGPDIPRIIADIDKREESRKRIINLYRRIKKMRNIWKEQKPDVIVSFIGKNNFMAIVSSLWLPTKVMVSVRGEPHEEYSTSLMWIMANILFTFSDGIIFQTKKARNAFGKRIQRKSVILRNPIHESFIRPPFERKHDKEIVSVGRLDSNKNHEMLIKAFKNITAQYSEYKLIIYGEGENRENLEKLIHGNRLEDKVFLPGSVSDIPEKVEKASIFVLTSNTEGMPNALIEAMMLGVPSISTDCPCGGPGEIIQDGINGCLIPVGDVQKLKEKLVYLLDNAETRIQIGNNARKIADMFTPDAVYQEWQQYITSVCHIEK